ncbi:hypothetical protein CLOM_g24358 [Closterium sp. NIES-68]|nr:hypothetical protein CLOM_g24358 [Closterium sp. NIES-68]
MGRAARSLLAENRVLMSLLSPAPAPAAHRLFPPLLSTAPPPLIPPQPPSRALLSGELQWVVQGKPPPPRPPSQHATPTTPAPSASHRTTSYRPTGSAAATAAVRGATLGAVQPVSGPGGQYGGQYGGQQQQQQQQQQEVMLERVCVELRAVISLASTAMEDTHRNAATRGSSSTSGAGGDGGDKGSDAALAASVAEAVAVAEGRGSGSTAIMCTALAAVADLPHELPLTSQQYLEVLPRKVSAARHTHILHSFAANPFLLHLLAAAAEALQARPSMVAWVHASVGEEVVRALLADAISHATVAANNASAPLSMAARARAIPPTPIPSRPSSPATPRATATNPTITTAIPSPAPSSPPSTPAWLHRLPSLASFMHAAAWLPSPLARAASLAHLLSPRDLADLLLLLWHCMDYAIAAGPLFAFSPWKPVATGVAAGGGSGAAGVATAGAAGAGAAAAAAGVGAAGAGVGDAATAGSDSVTAGVFGAPELILHPPSQAAIGGSAAHATQATAASPSSAPPGNALLSALLQHQQPQEPAAVKPAPQWRGVLLALVRRNIATLGPFARQLLLDDS